MKWFLPSKTLLGGILLLPMPTGGTFYKPRHFTWVNVSSLITILWYPMKTKFSTNLSEGKKQCSARVAFLLGIILDILLNRYSAPMCKKQQTEDKLNSHYKVILVIQA